MKKPVPANLSWSIENLLWSIVKYFIKDFFIRYWKKIVWFISFFFGMLFPYSGFWVSWNTTSGKGNHECSIGIITSGRRPRVIIPILHKWLPLPRVVFHDTQNPLYGNNIPKFKMWTKKCFSNFIKNEFLTWKITYLQYFFDFLLPRLYRISPAVHV